MVFGNINEYRFSRLPINNNQSTNTILAIIQDSYGFIWIGTSEGAYKYDGYNYRHYRNQPNDTNSLSHNEVFTITEDKNSNIWLGTRYGLNKIHRNTNRVERIIDSHDKNEIPKIEIYAILCDSKNNLWIGTNGSGILKICDGETEIERVELNSKSVPDRIRSIYEDSNGNIWVGTRNNGVFKINSSNTEIINYKHNSDNKFSISGNHIRSIHEDGDKNIWIGTENNGVNILKNHAFEFTNGNNNATLKKIGKEKVRCLLSNKNDELWIGTKNGLYIYQTLTGEIINFQNQKNDEHSLANNSIRALIKDYQGNIWIGTYFGGINIFFETISHFRYLPSGNNKLDVLKNAMVSSAIKVNSELWLGTENQGLISFDKNKKVKEVLFSGDELPYIKTLLNDEEGNVWIGTYGKGLFKYQLKGKKRYSYFDKLKDKDSVSYNDINVLFLDLKKNLWVGTNTGGLYRYEKENDSFIQISKNNGFVDLRGKSVFTITELASGELCLGTNIGLGIYDAKQNTVVNISMEPNSEGLSISNNTVSSLMLLNNDLWIGTSGGGVNKLDLESNKITFYNEGDGLSNEVIRGMESDSENNLWISTNKGIFLFNQESKTFVQYDAAEGLIIESFYPGAHFKDNMGNIYFGAIDGMVWFNPDDIEINTYQAPLYITGIKEFNKLLANKYIYYGNEYTDDLGLILPHHIRGLTFEFASLNYQASEKNTYAYQLENYFEDWIELGTSHSITFSTLPPGTYTLNIRAANNHKVWNNKGISIPIIINPPMWKTWYAYVCYTVFILFLFYLFRRVTLSWAHIKHQLESEKTKSENEKELNQLKLRFFTNVSHEFRTPLTLIINAAETLKSKLSKADDLHLVKTLSKNSDRLLQLLVELMEFRKAESGVLELRLVRWDIVKFLKDLTDNFHSYAERKNIDLIFNSDVKTLNLNFDPSKMEKIFVNLFSNGLKHGCSKVFINLSLTESFFAFSISNDGDEIPEKDQQLIFERFYQAGESTNKNNNYSSGTGIGLALTKELVKLHEGDIRLDCSKDKLTSFIVELPLVHSSVDDSQFSELKQKDWTYNELSDGAGHEENKPDNKEPEDELNYLNKENVILVVEDNQELLDYLKTQLRDKFEVLCATDGLQGLEIAKSKIPDLIISDIMMPKLNGIELCKKLKNDTLTSHVPLILLTAKGSDESKIEGYETGADLYIPKPFNINILRAQIDNQLQTHKRLRAKFAGMSIIEAKRITSNRFDSVFLEKTIALVEENMEHPEFDILSLCQKLFMSRSVFYRKIKALTDLQPQEFIKNLRLRKAAYLLKEQNMSVAQASAEVGFVNTKHFSTSFKKLYKLTPSDYKNSLEA